MSVQLIVNATTGERGYQARVGWQTPVGGSRYFSCNKYGQRKALQLAKQADRELITMSRQKI